MTTSHDDRPTVRAANLAERIEYLKSLCDWLTIANVTNDDTPKGYSWEVVGYVETDDAQYGAQSEQVVAGHGFTVGGAVTDAIVHVGAAF